MRPLSQGLLGALLGQSPEQAPAFPSDRLPLVADGVGLTRGHPRPL